MNGEELIQHVLCNRYSPDGQEHSVGGLLFFGQGYHYTSNYIALRCHLTKEFQSKPTYYLDEREIWIVVSYLIGQYRRLDII